MDLCVRNRKRDLKVFHMRKNLKWTFVRIAQEFDISKARARQLYMRIAEERNEGEDVSRRMGIGA